MVGKQCYEVASQEEAMRLLVITATEVCEEELMSPTTLEVMLVRRPASSWRQWQGSGRRRKSHQIAEGVQECR